jgi:predicted nucleic acid binding AN1-type Zn finger protein
MSTSISSSDSFSTHPSVPMADIPKPKSQVRCAQADCKKKLMLSDFECKCGTRYCATHRFPQDHACTFDFKAASAVTLGKQLVKCAGERMADKI